jgi:hypothetical protein
VVVGVEEELHPRMEEVEAAVAAEEQRSCCAVATAGGWKRQEEVALDESWTAATGEAHSPRGLSVAAAVALLLALVPGEQRAHELEEGEGRRLELEGEGERRLAQVVEEEHLHGLAVEEAVDCARGSEEAVVGMEAARRTCGSKSRAPEEVAQLSQESVAAYWRLQLEDASPALDERICRHQVAVVAH